MKMIYLALTLACTGFAMSFAAIDPDNAIANYLKTKYCSLEEIQV
jgi:hypothetical protein